MTAQSPGVPLTSSWTYDDDNIVVGHYGPSGIGKSVDLGYSFPNALFVAAPGAMHSIRSVCGYSPHSIQIPTIMEATKLLPELSKQFDQIVFDDFSFLCEQTSSVLESKWKGFQFWGKLRDTVIDFRNECRYTKFKVVAISCWEKPPKHNNEGARIRGGMDLPSKMPEQVPALCDMVLRAMHEPQRVPWPSAYHCYVAGDYAMKDRFDIVPRITPAPMNFGEILRAAGIEIPRHESLPDQEADVSAIADSLSGDIRKDSGTINEVYKALVDRGTPISAARWTMRDAMDRSVIRNALAHAGNSFVTVPTLGL